MRRWVIGGVVVALVVTIVLWRVLRREDRAGEPTATAAPSRIVGPGMFRAGGASIAGTVRDRTGAPIAGASVCVDGAAGDVDACAMTSPRGTYALGGLAVDRYEVVASAPRFVPTRYRTGAEQRVTPVLLAAGERRTGIDIVLDDGAVALTGTVVDVSGGPIAGALVRAQAEWRGDSRIWFPPVESDAAGAFTLWVPPGNAVVQAHADGYASAKAHGVAPGSVAVLLTPEASIAGTVVDTAGKPVPNAEVTAKWIDVEVTVRSDATGAFQVASLLPGRYEVRARAERGYGEASPSVRVGLAENVTGVVVRVHRAGRITGRVVTKSGAPCPDANVTLNRVRSLDDIQMIRTGDGAFVADGVRPATYYAHPSCAGHFPERRYPPIVVAGSDHELVWTVHPGATVRGHVRDSKGAPIAHANVQLRSRERSTSMATLVDGSYLLDGIAPGTYKLEAETEGGGHTEVELTITSADAIERDLTLDDGALIVGTVRDTRHRPVPGVSVQASGDVPKLAETGTGGTFEIAVRPGTYRVYPAQGLEALAEERRVEVAAGQTVTLELTIAPRTGVIRGDVVDRAGTPIGDAYVSAFKSSWGSDDRWMWSLADKPVLTAADGTFEIGGLGTGTYTVFAVRKGGGAIQQKGVEVGAEVHLVMPTFGSIAGTVRYADGAAANDVELTVRDAGSFFREEMVYETGGTFRIDELPAGMLTIAAVARDGLGVGTFELAPGQQLTGATLTIDRHVRVTGRVIDAVTKQPLADYFVIPRTTRARLGTFADPNDIEHLTDATGRFSILTATGPGALHVSSREFMNMHACRLSVPLDLQGATDLGDIAIVTARLAPGDKPGHVEMPADAKDITAIDGVTGESLKQCRRTLLAVAPGTRLELQLASGRTVSVTAGPPRDD